MTPTCCFFPTRTLVARWMNQSFRVCLRTQFSNEQRNGTAGPQPQSGARLQPRAQALGESDKRASPGGAKDRFSRTHLSASLNGLFSVTDCVARLFFRPFRAMPSPTFYPGLAPGAAIIRRFAATHTCDPLVWKTSSCDKYSSGVGGAKSFLYAFFAGTMIVAGLFRRSRFGPTSTIGRTCERRILR